MGRGPFPDKRARWRQTVIHGWANPTPTLGPTLLSPFFLLLCRDISCSDHLLCDAQSTYPTTLYDVGVPGQ